MNEIIEFAKIEKIRRAEKVAENCKEINTWTIVGFFIMLGLNIVGIVPDFMVYAYILLGTIILAVSTILLAVQNVKVFELEDEYEDEEV